jgi:colanic acid biosynthesis glycosyl transferase WcaI
VVSKDQVPAELLIVTQWYRPELIGTAFYIAELAEWFASRGSEVAVLTNRPNYPGDEVFPEYRDGSHDRETLENVAVRRLPTKVAVRGKAKAGLSRSSFSRSGACRPTSVYEHRV